ncbi:MAG TPA: succinylglutamate desuccinylase/aspartoacylase family protein [Geminicoccaceae bacterium]|nr:succinylglutamate desuccinylase/aspartoacylase family protein [Geminicoccaceae bacterium]
MAGVARTTAEARSRVITAVDYDRRGKQVAVLRVPQSRNDSGWGTVGIPIVVINNGSGPTFLLTGGTHGDEYEGPIALMNLARALEPAQVQGRMIVIPSLHLPAALAGTRLSPIDNRDLNRCFPGDPDGTFAFILADYVTRFLLPISDYNLDLHSGGRSMDFVVSTTSHVLDDRDRMARTLELARAFGAPYHVVIREVDSSHTFMTTAERMGVVAISSELGGCNRVSIEGVAATERGVRNVLRRYGVLEGAIEAPPQPTRIVTVPDYDCYAFAPRAGLFQPYHPLGAAVRAGEPAGVLHAIEDPMRPAEVVRYGRDGVLWCTRGYARVREGDPVAVIICDYDDEG